MADDLSLGAALAWFAAGAVAGGFVSSLIFSRYQGGRSTDAETLSAVDRVRFQDSSLSNLVNADQTDPAYRDQRTDSSAELDEEPSIPDVHNMIDGVLQGLRDEDRGFVMQLKSKVERFQPLVEPLEAVLTQLPQDFVAWKFESGRCLVTFGREPELLLNPVGDDEVQVAARLRKWLNEGMFLNRDKVIEIEPSCKILFESGESFTQIDSSFFVSEERPRDENGDPEALAISESSAEVFADSNTIWTV